MSKAELSKLLFLSRESIEMFADIVESQSSKVAAHQRKLVNDIDDYRIEQGWNPHGFGGEDDD